MKNLSEQQPQQEHPHILDKAIKHHHPQKNQSNQTKQYLIQTKFNHETK